MGKLRHQEMNLYRVTDWKVVATLNHTALPAPAPRLLSTAVSHENAVPRLPTLPLVTKALPHFAMPLSAPLCAVPVRPAHRSPVEYDNRELLTEVKHETTVETSPPPAAHR